MRCRLMMLRGKAVLTAASVAMLAHAAPAFAADTKPAGAGLCSLLSQDEAGKQVGKPVGQGKIAGPLGSACQWTASDDEGYLQIQAVPADYWSPPSLAEGYRTLSGIGEAAYVVPEPGGWSAATKTAQDVIVISLAGPAVTAEAAVDLLKTIAGRRP